jgi:hypothetical protein
MIPLLEPAQYPAILANGLLIVVIIGIPTALTSLAIFFVVERVPFRWGRLFLPAAGAVLMLSVTLLYFSGIPQSPEEYQRTWVQMMMTSFLLNALVILAPFPFIRKYTPLAYPPYLVIPFTVLVTFFLLVAFGIIGGDAQRPPTTEYAQMMVRVYLVVAEVVVATLVYGCIGWLGTKMPGGMARGD